MFIVLQLMTVPRIHHLTDVVTLPKKKNLENIYGITFLIVRKEQFFGGFGRVLLIPYLLGGAMG